MIQITVDGHKGGKDGQTEAENRNQCYYCNQVCQNANTLRRHCRQAHGKDRCHVCTLCNKAFKRATHLKVRTRGKNNGIQWSKAFNLSHWMLIHWYPSSYCLLFVSRVEALLMKTWASCLNEYSVWSKINKSGLPVPILFLVVSASSDRPLHTLALNNKTLTLSGALQPTQGDEHVRLSFLTQERSTLSSCSGDTWACKCRSSQFGGKDVKHGFTQAVCCPCHFSKQSSLCVRFLLCLVVKE